MAGMLYNMANLANAKLTANLTSSATTVTLDDASPFASLGTFYATLMPAGDMSRLSNSEIVKCDYVSSTSLSIQRGQRGTTARAFNSGDILTNGIYVEDLEQVQSVGNTVFETAYSSGTYRITSNNEMLPAIPTDGMKITVRINTDSSGTPKLDLQNTGASYNIYTGTQVNNELGTHAESSAAALLAGETYELVFDAEVGGGCWKAAGLVQLSGVPFYEQVGSGSSHPINTNDIEDGAVTPGKTSFCNYSTTEVAIGTWINGKPLYRKVVDCGAAPNASTKNVSTGLTYANVTFVEMTGFVVGSSFAFPINNVRPANNVGSSIGAYITSSSGTAYITIETATDRTNLNVYIVLVYAKNS